MCAYLGHKPREKSNIKLLRQGSLGFCFKGVKKYEVRKCENVSSGTERKIIKGSREKEKENLKEKRQKGK